MLEFNKETHTYWLDGVKIPCVSDILHSIFPNKYSGINIEILSKKAQYGSIVHKAIECLEQNLDMPQLNIYQELSIDQYKKIKEKNKIKVKSQEKQVHYRELYAGTYDMVATVNGVNSLIDIKTTAGLDEEYLSWQLSYYELAIGKRFKKLYCLWLPKNGLGELKEIKRKTKKELLERLEIYYNGEIDD